MTDVNKEKWYNVRQASDETGASRQAITLAIRSGKLIASEFSDNSRWGHHYMISESELLRWLEDKKSVKASVAKAVGDLTIEDIAKELTLRIQKAYETGYKDGKKDGKAEILAAIKGVK